MSAHTSLTEIIYLVVAGNRDSRALTRTTLESIGIRYVLEAADARAAMEILRTVRVGAVIVEMDLPGPMSGVDFTKKVRRSDKSLKPEVPIIMLTTNANRQTVLDARDSGIHEFLARPLTSGALYDRVKKAASVPRQFVHEGDYIGPARRWLGEGGAIPVKKKKVATGEFGHPKVRVFDWT